MIVLPESLIEIGVNSFEQCSKLEEVIIRGSNVVVRDGAFSGCNRLYKIDGSRISCLGREVFAHCAIREIDISGIDTIPMNCFSGDHELEQVVLSDDLQMHISIAEEAFEYCYSLWCINMQRVQSVGPSAFMRTAIQEAYFEDVPSIAEKAFYQCCELEHVGICWRRIKSDEESTFREEILRIGDRAWGECRALKTITVLWDGPIDISENAFEGNDATIICIDYSPLHQWLLEKKIQNIFPISGGNGIKNRLEAVKFLISI